MVLNDADMKPEANNITALRLLLASLVIYTHSYWLTTNISARDDLSDYLGATVSVYAVDGFFFLSGFLVYPSLLRMGRAGQFLIARAARLWPGLALSVLLTVIAGAFLSSAHGLAYLKGPTAKFVLMNISFLQGSFNLTGVRCGAALCTVNGSLWTLPWEARCYLGLALLGVTGLARPDLFKRFVLPATLVGALVWDIPQVQHATQSILGEGVVFELNLADRLWPLFSLGAAAYVYRERLPLSWPILAGLFVVTLIANALGVGLHVRAVFVGYLVLCLGLLTARTRAFSGRWPDYSYGMYIYAFPVMMGVHALWPGFNRWGLAAATFAGTLPFAAASWHLAEKPVLGMVKSFRARRRLVAAPAA
jgi:peptidoglycan/LPS O-acetylase OafA/YrhL